MVAPGTGRPPKGNLAAIRRGRGRHGGAEGREDAAERDEDDSPILHHAVTPTEDLVIRRLVYVVDDYNVNGAFFRLEFQT